ncbi:hypothetical protein [Pontibacter korlensis]|uniref:hypothetical protein n=1 Tax=Pontibacter korlensis TaxID=400092 RepID=UPI000A46ABA6|nr:hypothetical protein [Pontibacter korlensis]
MKNLLCQNLGADVGKDALDVVQHPFTFAGFGLTLCSTACTCRLLPLLQQTCPAPGCVSS